MIEFSATEIAAVTGGRLSEAAQKEPTLVVSSAATDSRESRPGGLFIAKPGETTDGHNFVAAAFANGAVLALAERAVADDDGTDLPAVVVPDAVEAMGKLAAETVRRLREHSPLTVIGITGSAGKTTTKDVLAQLLGAEGPTVAPIGSYNGEIGVPLTVFSADYGTRYLVIEMGATGAGHIDYLCSMVKPDIGVVLCVGSAHAGEFGGVERIAEAKSELPRSLGEKGLAILNADDHRVRGMSKSTQAPVVYFSEDSTFESADSAVVRAEEVFLSVEGNPCFTLVLPNGARHDVRPLLIGRHHVANLLAAASAAHAAGVPGEKIAAGLCAARAVSRWRMERTDRADGVTVINDAYNANPESMRAALATLAELGRGRRTWAVLGEMLELGEESVTAHDAIGRVVVRLNISKLIVVGDGARALHAGAVLEGSWGDEALFARDVSEAAEILDRELVPGDLVLVKSSNGAGLRHLGDRIALASDSSPAVPDDHPGSQGGPNGPDPKNQGGTTP
ncbi:UDP-N-acetylmuramoyl-tripeptide--D-alanyl-D-alanine ligase [Arthrobacter pigmenti]|uniref:UDP-N-acetylmuramoyl-tripeptide--D-alanyl-D-alanine ligase n=1 Tax=Arthrobacter pigmenti TaxID=271432 RepID=A0A846RN87_9MICC|nr:UDP-N-acetylmuramoyl-tripeptide--D-alanyl-D-alanine ligase [Arthrobacter pigmenti]NJC22082.1 UDP-N-acetylmuramoyl-tripeptide--D-alanyl-D-alanine ligase [Arthrobacter pigmenti]